MSAPNSSAVRALALEYKGLQEEPVEGFRVKLLNESNLFEWQVAIFGPPDTSTLFNNKLSGIWTNSIYLSP